MLGERERKTDRETLGEENIKYIADGSEQRREGALTIYPFFSK